MIKGDLLSISIGGDKEVKRHIMFLNDAIHKRTYLTHSDFADKLSAFKTKVYDCLVPAILNYPPIPGKNYYFDYLDIKLQFGYEN